MPRIFTFIGVTTAQSSIMRIFPRWRDALGLGVDVRLVGRDLPLHAPAADYRRVVDEIKRDPAQLGALITTHKLDLYRAAGDLIDTVDEYGRLLGEVSCLYKRDGRLLGAATDPICAGEAVREILDAGYFGRTGGEALCLGAGGAGAAIVAQFLTRPNAADRPQRIYLADVSRARLDHIRAVGGRLDPAGHVDYVHSADATTNDTLAARLPSYSIVINATGMGKDSPGSPVSDAASFPREGVAWDLNYRGDLTFLRQARRQRVARGLRVEDGWLYFIYGWTAVMEKVFNRPITATERSELVRNASFIRPDPNKGL